MTTFVVSKERNAAYRTMDAAYLDGAPFATLIEVKSEIDPAVGHALFCDGGDGDQMLVKSFSAAGRWMMYDQPAGERSVTAVAIRQ